MDKEGQDKVPDNSFESKNIGYVSTPEYFSNVKGGRKDKEKVERKRFNISHRTLRIIAIVTASLLAVILLITLIINLVASNNLGKRTHEPIPTELSTIETKAYEVAVSKGYGDALVYLTDLMADLEDASRDINLIFGVKALRIQMLYSSGWPAYAFSEAESLKEDAINERQRYTVFALLAKMYSWDGDNDMANYYRELAESVNVDDNSAEGLGDPEEGTHADE